MNILPSQRVDETCDAFAGDWRRGEVPDLEHYVGRLDDDSRDEGLRQLMLTDIEFRARQGLDPSADDYLARFPQQSKIILEVFDDRQLQAQLDDPPSEDTSDESASIALVVMSGPNQGHRFQFNSHRSFLVGRSDHCHFKLDAKDPAASRVHFILEVNPPLCRVTDAGSTNGVFVNEQRVESCDLADGDVIKAGRQAFQVEVSGPLGTPGRGDVRSVSGVVRPTAVFELEMTEFESDSAPDEEGNDLRRRAENLPEVPGYEILDEIGRGGMGVVYRARSARDNNVVAIKTLRPSIAASEREISRFLREAKILRQLKHPRIVSFVEINRVGDLLYFVMECVDGIDAATYLKKKQEPTSVRRAVSWTCQMLRALQAAHERGFVHRDVKPANIIVEKREGKDYCFLVDFGLARVYQSSKASGLTMQGDVGGTLPFMAPEQITDFREARPTVDQYSIGATLYRLLTNKHIHDFANLKPTEIMSAVLLNDPVPITARVPSIPTDLADVVHKAIAKVPGRRFESCLHMRKALTAFL